MQKPDKVLPTKCHLFRFISNNFGSGHGFQLGYESSNVSAWSYSIGKCGGNMTTNKGILTSPSYPENYPSEQDCYYTISQPTEGYLRLKNLIFNLKASGTTCNYDYLEVRDGISEDSTLIGIFCGNYFPESLHTTKNQVWMK